MIGLGFDLVEHGLPFFGGGVGRVHAPLPECLAGPKFSVAPQQDVSSTSSHIGGNGHRLIAAGLGDDFRLALVLFGIQHIMGNAALAQEAAEMLGLEFEHVHVGRDRLAGAVSVSVQRRVA